MPAVTPAEPLPAPPTADHDTDGIPDAKDRCPDEPEDRDQFEDDDGCVDRDNDGDGILDAHEFKNGRWTNCDYRREDNVDVDCRNLPENRFTFGDHDGCPDTIRLDTCPMKLSAPLHLDRRGRLAADAPKLLDEVAATMHAAPDVEVWVAAHVDKQRDPATAKRMSQRAADEAIEALVRRGIARERLAPIGYGDERPLDPRATASGRAHNRRIEFSLRTCWRDPGPLAPETHECY